MKQETNEEILKKIFAFKKEGLKVLVGSLMIEIIIGIFFAWPVIYSYHNIMVQYPYLSSSRQFLVYLIFPMMTFTMNLCLPRGDKILNSQGPKHTVLIFASMICISLTLIGFFKDYIILHFLLLVVVIGPSLGFLYMIPFHITWKYFIKQKTHLNSLFQLFIGIGACIFIYVFEQKSGFDALSLYYDQGKDFQGLCHQIEIREAYRHSALLVFGLGFLSALLVRVPDEKYLETMLDYDLLAYSHEDVFNQQDISMDVLDKDIPTFSKAISGLQFRTMVFAIFSLAFLPYLLMSQYQSISKLAGISYQASTTAYKATIICYGLQRWLIQFLTQSRTYEKIIQSLINVKIAIICCIFGGLWFNGTTIFLIAISAMVTILNGIFSTVSINIPRIFGSMIASQIFGVMLMVFAITNLFQSLVFYKFQEDFRVIASLISLIILTFMCLLARMIRNG